MAAAQAAAFYFELESSQAVWTVKDDGGFPAPKNGEGRRSQPFWSKESRARKIIATVPAYSGFDTYEISLEEFRASWLPSLERDGLLIGLNWSGDRALGYDVEPATVLSKLPKPKRTVGTILRNLVGKRG